MSAPTEAELSDLASTIVGFYGVPPEQREECVADLMQLFTRYSNRRLLALIGEDETYPRTNMGNCLHCLASGFTNCNHEVRNQLRAELRSKLLPQPNEEESSDG